VESVHSESRLPRINTGDSLKDRWDEFRGLSIHRALMGDLYFTTDNANLIASLIGLSANDTMRTELERFLGVITVMLPISVSTRAFLVGLRRNRVMRLRKMRLSVTATLPLIGQREQDAIVVEDGPDDERRDRLVEVCNYMMRLFGFCNTLAGDGHVILCEFIATLHLVQYYGAVGEPVLHPCTAPRNRVHASDPGLLAMDYQQKIECMTTCIGGCPSLSGIPMIETILSRVDQVPVLNRLMVVVPDAVPYRSLTLRRIPLSVLSSPSSPSSESGSDGSSPSSPSSGSSEDEEELLVETDTDSSVHLLSDGQILGQLQRNYDFWDEIQKTEAGRQVIPMPDVLGHIMSSMPDLQFQDGYNATTDTAKRWNLGIRALGENMVISTGFFRFIASLYKSGVFIHMGLLTSIAIIRNSWRIRLPVTLRRPENMDATHLAERGMLQILCTVFHIAADEYDRPSKNPMTVSAQTSVLHTIICYRIRQLRDQPDECMDLALFWNRACSFADQMSTTAPNLKHVRTVLNIARNNRSWSDTDEVHWIRSVLDNSPTDDKAVFVGDMLSLFCRFYRDDGIDPSRMIRRMGNMSFKLALPNGHFHAPSSNSPFEDLVPTGSGTVVHALTMFWKCIIDPELQFFEPLRSDPKIHSPTERMKDSGYPTGLLVAIIASGIFKVMPTLRLHPYMFNGWLDEDVNTHESTGVHPFAALVAAGTPETDAMVRNHLSVLFHVDPCNYLEYDDAYGEYEDRIAAAVRNHRRFVGADDVWGTLFTRRLQRFLQLITTGSNTMNSGARYWSAMYLLSCPLHDIPLDAQITSEHVMRHLTVRDESGWCQSSWFKSIVEAMDPTKARSLVMFATGKDRLVKGDKIAVTLTGEELEKNGRAPPCPTASTCTSKVYVVYDYKWSEQQFKDNVSRLLDVSLEHCQTFGFR
jgi:hypothetical protein